MEIHNVAVIGAGTMGNGIAHVFAQNGYAVQLVDVDEALLKKALSTISGNLDRQIKKGTVTEEQKSETLSHIKAGTDLKAGVAAAELVVEAVSEDLKIKTQIFRSLDSFSSPKAILASNTSSMSITELGATAGRPETVIGMHFMNPVPVMKLVEVIRGLATSDETLNTVVGVCAKLGKTAVEVHDYPGFVSNRVLLPMINEAVYCVMEGVATAEAIDEVMKLGMAHPMGPLTLADFIGLDVCLAIMNVLHEGLGDESTGRVPS